MIARFWINPPPVVVTNGVAAFPNNWQQPMVEGAFPQGAPMNYFPGVQTMGFRYGLSGFPVPAPPLPLGSLMPLSILPFAVLGITPNNNPIAQRAVMTQWAYNNAFNWFLNVLPNNLQQNMILNVSPFAFVVVDLVDGLNVPAQNVLAVGEVLFQLNAFPKRYKYGSVQSDAQGNPLYPNQCLLDCILEVLTAKRGYHTLTRERLIAGLSQDPTVDLANGLSLDQLQGFIDRCTNRDISLYAIDPSERVVYSKASANARFNITLFLDKDHATIVRDVPTKCMVATTIVGNHISDSRWNRSIRLHAASLEVVDADSMTFAELVAKLSAPRAPRDPEGDEGDDSDEEEDQMNTDPGWVVHSRDNEHPLDGCELVAAIARASGNTRTHAHIHTCT
jgi:hypothetical protein